MRMVAVNGVELCVDTFGRPADPAILLVGGSGGSMDWWPVEFCTRLADGGRFVIRYDHRDTGQSTTYPPGAPGYTGADLVTDIVGVLDALGLRTAQLVGISMGGALAQVATLDHPDRISSLVLMSTSALHPDLAVTTDELRAFYADRAEPDWADRDAVIERIVAEDRALAGAAPFDETASRATAVRASTGRTTSPRPATTPSSRDRVCGGSAWARSGCRRSSSTAGRIRCSRCRTARRWPGTSRTHR
jgi:pimeloyl-ACP methyl ester carboxylesterase